jgi:hypothetical protein
MLLASLLVAWQKLFGNGHSVGELLGWSYRSAGPGDVAETQVLLPEEVWHDKLPNPFNPWRGLAGAHGKTTGTPV